VADFADPASNDLTTWTTADLEAEREDVANQLDELEADWEAGTGDLSETSYADRSGSLADLEAALSAELTRREFGGDTEVVPQS
jgi:hypothetical protein